MKKNLHRKTITLLLLLALIPGFRAALSGVYTINSALSTSGSNFQSFTDFASAINTQGVSGPVTVNVVASSGPYYEQVLFNQITGASSVNRITINGNNNLLSFGSNNYNQPYVMGFNGADYFTVNNLNMEGTGTYAWVALFYNNANYNVLSACSMSADINATSYEQVPIIVNGNGTYVSWSNGPSGNNNLFQGCTTYGGYWGIMIFGDYNLPYVTGNQIVDCHVTDFYYQGISVEAYCENLTIKNNLVECPTITNNDWARYGIYTYGTRNTVMDGNWVRNLFGGNISSTDYCYPIYCGGNLESYYTGESYPSTRPNYCRNNIVSDIEFDGTIFGIYGEGWDGYIYNNTVSLDHSASSGWGETYGIYSYGEPGYYVSHVINNIVSITRGNSGDMFGFYNASWSSSSTDLPVERNDFYVNGSGSNYIGVYTGYASSLAQLQTQGANVVGWDVDPNYTSLGSNYKPTNTSINNQGKPMGLPLDQAKMPRSGTTPDIGALEFLSVACSGTPSPGSVVTPTFAICPGESVDMILSNFSSDLGISYQWQSSTQSSLGIWTPISGANSVLYTSPNVTATTWFQVVVTCTNSNQTVSPVGQVSVAATTTNTVPYFEGFENIGRTNRLPNCSWYSSEIGGSVRTFTTSGSDNKIPRSGKCFASFYYSPPGVRSMYTNGIWMDAGVTYSASMWFTTEYYGYNNWTNLQILVGPNQNTTGQQVVASTNGAALSVIYKSLSGTFQVPTSGLYYVAISASVNTNGYAQNLSWDDLKIEIPCDLNAPTMTVSSSQTTLCANTQLNAMATGADTYSWSTGHQTDQISITPQIPGNIIYYVTGTHTLSGCATTSSLAVTVNPSPYLYAYSPGGVCPGSSIYLQAFGANNYLWSNNMTGNSILVSPASTTTYAVVGTNQFNCQSTAVVQVTVFNNPVISTTAPTLICVGDVIEITGNGGLSYELVSNSSYNAANPAYISPTAATEYTLYGTDANGCKGSKVFNVDVRICAGIQELVNGSSINVYPNPNNGTFMVDLGTANAQRLEVTDVTGRVIRVVEQPGTQTVINIADMSRGVYYIKVISDRNQKVTKVITD